MNPELQYTWSNITIQFTEQQKAIILADQQRITRLESEKNTLVTNLLNQKPPLEASYATEEQAIAFSQNQLNTVCHTYFFSWDRKECEDQNNARWDEARNNQASIIEQLNVINNNLNPNVIGSTIYVKNAEIASAKQTLNNDILTIQNQIKLQIQAQIANSTAATQNASNIAGINQNDPALLQAQLNAQHAEDLAALQNQAAKDKLQQEQTIKIATFSLVALVIIGLAIVVIRRVI